MKFGDALPSSYTTDRACSSLATKSGLSKAATTLAKLFQEKTLFSGLHAGRKVRSAWKIVNRKSREACWRKLSLRIHITRRNGVTNAEVFKLLARRIIMCKRKYMVVSVRKFYHCNTVKNFSFATRCTEKEKGVAFLFEKKY